MQNKAEKCQSSCNHLHFLIHNVNHFQVFPKHHRFKDIYLMKGTYIKHSIYIKEQLQLFYICKLIKYSFSEACFAYFLFVQLIFIQFFHKFFPTEQSLLSQHSKNIKVDLNAIPSPVVVPYFSLVKSLMSSCCFKYVK